MSKKDGASVISYQLYISSIDSLWHGYCHGTGKSFIHEKTERSHASGGFSLFGTSVRVHGLDDLGDGSPRHDVLGRLLLRDLVGEVVGPRPGVVFPRRDVLGRVRERDLGLDGVDDGGFGLLSGTPQKSCAVQG